MPASSILIVSPLSDRFNGIGNFGAPALGVWRLKANCEAAGHRADIFDCNLGSEIPKCETVETLVEAFYDKMKAEFDLDSYEWFGFSILNDTLPLTLGLANLIKLRHPSAKQISGNAEATLNYQDILDKSKIDAVLVGEADFSLPGLLSGGDPRHLEGCIWFTRAKRMSPEEFYDAYRPMNWNSLPLVEYGAKTMRLYADECIRKEIPEETLKRMMLREIPTEDAAFMIGLPHDDYLKKLYSCMTVRWVTMDHCFLPCTYCSTARIPDFATGKFERSVFLPLEAIKELALRVKREVPGVLAIYDDSDETFLGTKRGLDYAKTLQSIKAEMDKDTPRGFRWLVQTRTNEMTQELTHELGRAGVEHLTFGVENASAYVRDSIRKKQDDQQILDVIDWCNEAKIQCYYLLILFPPETRIVDLEINVRVIHEWVRRGAQVSAEPFLMPYRGTPILDDPRYHYEHITYDVPFSYSGKGGGPLKKLKWPTLVWPRDPKVLALMKYFRATLDWEILQAKRAIGHAHTFKGFTGIVCVDHLARCLELFHKGEIRLGMDWRMEQDANGIPTGVLHVMDSGGEGVPSAPGEVRPVYQEYATRESGLDLKTRSLEETNVPMVSPVGRFNPTHSSIDEEAVSGLKQGGSKLRLQKDANAPGEVIQS